MEEVLENRASCALHRKSSVGTRPLCYRNTNNIPGSMCSSAAITRHCYGLRDTSETKHTVTPSWSSSLEKSKDSTFLGTVCQVRHACVPMG